MKLRGRQADKFRFRCLGTLTQGTTIVVPYESRFTFWILLIFWFSVAAVAAQSPLQIIQADTDSLLIKFETPTLQFSSQEINGRTFTRIYFTGATLTTQVGRPSLPIYPRLIGIPIDASPHVTVIDSRLEVRQTEPIIPAPTIRTRQPPNRHSSSIQIFIDGIAPSRSSWLKLRQSG